MNMTGKVRCTIVAAGVAALLFALPKALSAEDTEGFVKATGTPGSAGVFADGKYLGPATRFTVAERYPLGPGEHNITLRDPRYHDFTTKVIIYPGSTVKVKYQLKPAELAKPPFGRLRFGGGVPESFMSVASGDTSAVYLNGRFYGYVDELNNAGGGLLLNPGVYRLRVSSPVYGEIDRDVTIKADQVTVVPLSERES